VLRSGDLLRCGFDLLWGDTAAVLLNNIEGGGKVRRSGWGTDDFSHMNKMNACTVVHRSSGTVVHCTVLQVQIQYQTSTGRSGLEWLTVPCMYNVVLQYTLKANYR